MGSPSSQEGIGIGHGASHTGRARAGAGGAGWPSLGLGFLFLGYLYPSGEAGWLHELCVSTQSSHALVDQIPGLIWAALLLSDLVTEISRDCVSIISFKDIEVQKMVCPLSLVAQING